MSFVVDASVTMAWCFEDEKNDYTESVLDRLASESAVVPAVWPFEVVNVLLMAERRGRLSPAAQDAFLYTIGELPINVAEFNWPSAAETLLLRGRLTGLTAYDAAYLGLALRFRCPLATQDQKLRTAAEKLGVPVL